MFNLTRVGIILPKDEYNGSTERSDYMLKKIKEALPTYIVAVALPLAVGAVSALLTRENMDIYSELSVPPLAPPAWLFPIAWTILYILMGISSAMVYLQREHEPQMAERGLIVYFLSLVVNFTWSIIFFNMRSFIFAFIWLLLLVYLIIRTILYYRRVSPVAAYLQIPYLIWVLFAGYLNLGIYLLS